MGDMTLDDLTSDSSNGSSSSSGGGSGGEWITNVIDKLDEKGILEPMIFGEQRSMDEIRAENEGSAAADQAAQQQPTGGDTADAAAAAQQLDADQLKQVMLEVYDRTDMVPGLDDDPKLSDLIKLVDSSPEMVNGLIQEHL